ncbi:MAG: hypothetical protein AAF496_16095 [Pseudomonadota bacterium]
MRNLWGSSGQSDDRCDLLASPENSALDAMVICGGIKEHAAPIRARLLRDVALPGMGLDMQANIRNDEMMSSDASEAD